MALEVKARINDLVVMYDPDEPERSNQGKTWAVVEEQNLIAMWKEGMSVEELARRFQRSVGGLIARLDMLRLIRHESAPSQGNSWKPTYIMVVLNPHYSLFNKKESTMAIPTMGEATLGKAPTLPPAYEVKAFIYGTLAENVSDETIFQHIADLESQIKKLEAIGNKPKKLTARIKALQDQITALITYCDER